MKKRLVVPFLLFALVVSAIGFAQSQEYQEFRPIPDHPPSTEKPIPVNPDFPPEPPSDHVEHFELVGESTRGARVEHNGIVIQLPQNAMLDGFIAHVECWDLKRCVKAPAWAFVMDSGAKIIIDSDMTIIDNLWDTDPKYPAYRAQFLWLEAEVIRQGRVPTWIKKSDIRKDGP